MDAILLFVVPCSLVVMFFIILNYRQKMKKPHIFSTEEKMIQEKVRKLRKRDGKPCNGQHNYCETCSMINDGSNKC